MEQQKRFNVSNENFKQFKKMNCLNRDFFLLTLALFYLNDFTCINGLEKVKDGSKYASFLASGMDKLGIDSMPQKKSGTNTNILDLIKKNIAFIMI